MFLSTKDNDFEWKMRDEDPGDRRVVHLLQRIDYENDEELSTVEAGDVVLLGYPDDRGVERNFGRSGASEAPDAIRAQLFKMCVHRERRIWDLGNFSAWSYSLSEAHDRAKEVVAKIRAKGAFALSLGGGHDWAYADFVETKERVLNIDSHLDMRPQPLEEECRHHSGTPFRRILEEKKGFNLGVLGLSRSSTSAEHLKWAEGRRVQIIFADELSLEKNPLQYIEQHFQLDSENFALSLDLDVFSQSVAPGVSAPAFEGLSLEVFLRFIRKYKNKVSQLGIYELCPRYDRDQQTARLAAHVIYETLFR